MDETSDISTRVSRLLEAEGPREAFVLFLDHVEDKEPASLSPDECRALDFVCQRVLPQLLEHHVLWMVNHPGRVRQALPLWDEALRAGLRAPTVLDQIAWLRCLLALSEAMAGRPDRVHEELCLVGGKPSAETIPPPNGQFQEQVKELEASDKAAAAFLRPFFDAYVAYLRRAGQHDLANHLENRVGRLLQLIARDERRPGVVQALLYEPGGTGHSRFVHVSLERGLKSEGDATPVPDILYARRAVDQIDAAMSEAADVARTVADAYLKRSGYPDGLDERVVCWEIGTLQGDPVDLPRQYHGGSIALPLVVAILSEYLQGPVPNDVASTGALSAVSASEGRVLPVDGIPEKVRHGALGGSRIIYLPSANAEQLRGRPALADLLAEHEVRVVPVDTVDQVCRELFPPEGSGRLSDTLKDTVGNVLQMVGLRCRRDEPQASDAFRQRHRFQALTSAAFLSTLVFLEGWMFFKALAPAHPAAEAWVRVAAAAGLVFLAMLATFSLPGASLKHRKRWSWFAGTGLVTGAFLSALLLLAPMLPDTAMVSRIHNAPPVAGLAKDLFVMWLFGWALVANIFNTVAAFEHLVARRQFVTARDCLRWNAPWEARMPIRCFHFPWRWGAVFIGVAVFVLVNWELNYYGSLYMDRPSGYWLTCLGLTRDLVFLGVIAQVMVFYKITLAEVRRFLT